MNFGLTLSNWDYMFKTDHIPTNNRNIELGFNGGNYPLDFTRQKIYPFTLKKKF